MEPNNFNIIKNNLTLRGYVQLFKLKLKMKDMNNTNFKTSIVFKSGIFFPP